ncbi:MAG: dUTP diphosphatase [Clostridia bacterium]|nr:dUTP diphosphatase [Clostridia bacterium]
MSILKIKKVRENAIIPKRATEGSAGMDLYACIDAPIEIKLGERVMVPTGIAIALPDANLVALIFARSGLAVKKGINLSNSVGVVDSDYRGEVQVGLINQSQETYTLEAGERIAQMVIMPVALPVIEEVAELDSTERGEGGFGSTGRKG